MSKRKYLMILVLALSAPVSFGADQRKPMGWKGRMALLPTNVAKAVLAEQAKLTKTLAGCPKAADPKSCRSEARNSYTRNVSGILTLNSAGANQTCPPDGDCFGDTEAKVKAACANGTVCKIYGACGQCLCVRASGCFNYVCVVGNTCGIFW